MTKSDDTEIVRLGPEHERALADFLAEFAAAGEASVPAFFGRPEWSHGETVRRFEAWSRGEVAEGLVPCTTLFLARGERLLGVTNVRHELNDALLRHGGHVGYSVRPSERGRGHGTRLLAGALAFCRATLGLDRILVTCQPENVGSVRVIERNGGVQEDERFHEGVAGVVRRYWIAL